MLGFDVAIHKSLEFESNLWTPQRLWIRRLFDSVGGSVSESVLQYANSMQRCNLQTDRIVRTSTYMHLYPRMNILRVRNFAITYDLNRWSDFDILLDYEDHFEDALSRLKASRAERLFLWKV